MEVDVGVLVLRLLVGGIFFYEGFHKLAAPADVPRGRDGLQRLIASKGLPGPALLMWSVCVLEVVCGGLVVVGLLTRLALVPLIVTVGIATFAFKWRAGYAGGWDWPFTVLGASLALLLLGAGGLSLDAVIDVPFGSSR